MADQKDPHLTSIAAGSPLVDSHNTHPSSPHAAGTPQSDSHSASSARPSVRPSGSAGGLNPRSCITCRKRKVRCDKAQPCSNCVRAQIPCQFPAPGRAPRRPRKPPDGELLARLRTLEGVVQSMSANVDDETRASLGHITGQPISAEPSDAPLTPDARNKALDWAADHHRSSIDSKFGRLVLEDGKSRYVNNNFWANLSCEVEDLKGILHDSEAEDHYTPSPERSPPLSPAHPHDDDHEHQAFVFQHASPGQHLHSMHPSPEVILEHWRVFEENVEPLTKMLHLPTMREQIRIHKDNPGGSPRGFEALLFAVYFASVTSLSPEECLSLTGEPRDVLVSRYRRGVERSLARASFLTTEEIIVLQAFVLFMLSLRRHEDSRVLYSLTGLEVRIAITMGLHRDGSNFGLSPFDTEMRRRLWWQICNLDFRLSEDHGSDPTILEHMFDTKFPLNIDDEQFQPDMPPTVTDKKGCITDMTFSLIRFEVANTFRRLNYSPPTYGKIYEKIQEITLQDKERWIEECHQGMEEKYLRHCDMSIPMHWVICTVARLILAKMWLTIYQPFQRLDGGASLPQDTRDRLFITSLESIEYALLLETELRTVKWGWLFKTYSQWHALAFLLSELCHRTKGPTVRRAWRSIDATVNEWASRVPHQKRGHLWRPLRKLMAKARAARDREVSLDNTLAHDDKSIMASIEDTQNYANQYVMENFQAGTNEADLVHGHHNGGPTQPGVDQSVNTMTGGNGTSTSAQNVGAAGFAGFNDSWASAPGVARNDSNAPSSNNGNDFVTSPFFANQPQIQPNQWSSTTANNAFLNDFVMGDAFSLPGGRTGATPEPMQMNNPMQNKSFGFGAMGGYQQQQAQQSNLAFGGGSFTGSGFNTGIENGGQEGPMVSGVDNEPIVQWDDWDDMVRTFEQETAIEPLGPGAGVPSAQLGQTRGVLGNAGDAWF